MKKVSKSIQNPGVDGRNRAHLPRLQAQRRRRQGLGARPLRRQVPLGQVEEPQRPAVLIVKLHGILVGTLRPSQTYLLTKHLGILTYLLIDLIYLKFTCLLYTYIYIYALVSRVDTPPHGMVQGGA